jgi:hypothetical protein
MKDLEARVAGLLASLNQASRDAAATWTPGEALGEITAQLNRVDSFPATSSAAAHAQRRMRWLTAVLAAAAPRSRAAGLDLDLGGVLSVLQQHDAALAAEQNTQAPRARAARELIRLEISLLLPPVSGAAS